MTPELQGNTCHVCRTLLIKFIPHLVRHNVPPTIVFGWKKPSEKEVIFLGRNRSSKKYKPYLLTFFGYVKEWPYSVQNFVQIRIFWIHYFCVRSLLTQKFSATIFFEF